MMKYTAGEDMRVGSVVTWGSDPLRTLLLARAPGGWAGVATRNIGMGEEITLGAVGSGADVVYWTQGAVCDDQAAYMDTIGIGRKGEPT